MSFDSSNTILKISSNSLALNNLYIFLQISKACQQGICISLLLRYMNMTISRSYTFFAISPNILEGCRIYIDHFIKMEG